MKQTYYYDESGSHAENEKSRPYKSSSNNNTIQHFLSVRSKTSQVNHEVANKQEQPNKPLSGTSSDVRSSLPQNRLRNPASLTVFLLSVFIFVSVLVAFVIISDLLQKPNSVQTSPKPSEVVSAQVGL